MPKKIIVPVSLKPDIVQHLKEVAAQENRAVSNVIEVLLERYLDTLFSQPRTTQTQLIPRKREV